MPARMHLTAGILLLAVSAAAPEGCTAADSSRAAARDGCAAADSSRATATNADAEAIAWKTDLKQAAREATRRQKPMLLEFTASWCGYCKKMQNTTFQNEGVARHVNECFVPVKVDYDTNEDLVKAVGVDGLPMTVVISPELTVVRKISGYLSPTNFTKRLRGLCPAASDRSKRSPRLAKRSAVKLDPAFGGHCLVSMVEDRNLRRGDVRFASRYRGKTLLFQSNEKRRKFEANPAKYWPMLDGNCPVARASRHRLQEGSARIPVIYRGRLWFFADREARRAFAASPARYAPRRTAKP